MLFFCLVCTILPGGLFELTAHAIDSSPQSLVAKELSYLDAAARPFHKLQCRDDDDFCWWFSFHLSIGESNPAFMQSFAEQVPVHTVESRGYQYFAGEAHIFQYLSYFLHKGVTPQTRLQSGDTLISYLRHTPWERVLQDSANGKHPSFINHELSWYRWSKRNHPQLLPDLADIPIKTDSLACAGSHYVTGGAVSHYLQDYLGRLGLMMQQYPQAAFWSEDDFEMYLVTHAIESLILGGYVQYITPQHIQYSAKYLEHFSQRYEQAMRQVHHDPHLFLQRYPDLAFVAGDVFGHFRNGLRLYSLAGL